MSTDRIRGLQLQFSTNDMEFVRSITNIRSSMRDLNQSFRTTLNNVKFDDKSVKNYESSIEDLTDAVKAQEQNLKSLKGEYEEVAKEKGENSKEAMKLRTEYNKQADNLNYLKNQLGNVTEEYKAFSREQKIANSGWTEFGTGLKDAGNMLNSMGSGMQTFGNNMTKYVTTPILGAVSAIAGFTAYQGWNRIVAMDNAEARLRGMGFDTDEIMPDVREGVTGTTLTSAEGASIAAGALPAGIAQGEELQEYIRLVDSFKIASGRSADDAALIMNRVVGGGRLMTGELNQIEDALPGFTKSMADAMDVSINDFRGMVTEGKVSSEQFLTSLEGYAGPISKEYAQTWEGIKANVKSNIGIIGELALGGVFDTAKEELSNFLDFLRSSDEMKEFARNVNVFLTENIQRLIGWVKDGINWWNEADESTRRWTLGIIGLVTAMGPILTIAGTATIVIGHLLTSLGAISTAIGRAGGLFAGLARGIGLLLSPIRVLLRPLLTLGTRFLALSNPIGWVVTGLAALGVGFYQAYKHSESFREFVDGIVLSLKGAWEWLVTFKDGIVALFRGEDDAIDIFESLGLSEEAIDSVSGWVDTVMETFEELKETFFEVYESISESLDRIWESVKTIFTQIIDFLGIDVEAVIEALKEAWANLKEWFKDDFIEQAFTAAKVSVDVFGETIDGLLKTADRVFEGVADALESISEGDWKGAWEDVKEMFSDVGAIWTDVWDNIKETIDEHFGDTIEAVKQWAIDLWDKINEWYGKKSLEVTGTLIGWYLSVLGWWDDLKTNISTKTEELWDDVKEWFKTKTREIIGTIAGWYLSLTGWWDSIKEAVSEKSEEIWSSAKEWFDQLPDSMRDALSRVGQTISGWGESLKNRGYNLGVNIANGVINGLNWMIDRVNDVARFLGLDRDLISPIGSIGYRSVGSGVTADAVKTYSSGTNFHTGGLALVGDKGFGNSPGGSGIGDRSVTRELIKLPDKTEYLADGNVLLDLPTGSQVLSNRETEDELKKRVFGTDVGGGMLDNMLNWMNIITKPYADSLGNQYVEQPKRIASVGHKLGDFAADLWSYASNPMSLFNEIFNDVVNKHLNVPEGMFPLAVGAINKLGGVMSDWIGGLFDKSGKADGSYILNKSISHFFGRYNAGAGSMLFGVPHYGIDTRHHYDPLHSPVNGKVTNTWFDAMGGNSIQVSQGNGRTWWFMHLDNIGVSKGANVNVGDYLGKTGNTGSFTTGPHLHTQLMQGGIGNAYAIDPLPTLRSHKNGGYIETDGLFNLHANEMVLPLDNPTYAMKLIALASKKMAGKSKQTSELPNVAMNNDSVVEKLVEQNSILMKMLEKLTGIESKDLVVGDEDIGRANDRYTQKQSSKHSMLGGRPNYV